MIINTKIQSLRKVNPVETLYAMEVDRHDLVVGEIYRFCDHGSKFIDGPIDNCLFDFLIEMKFLGEIFDDNIPFEVAPFLEQDEMTKLFKFYNSETVRGTSGGLSLVRTTFGSKERVFQNLLADNDFGVVNQYGEKRPEISVDAEFIEDDLKLQAAWDNAQEKLRTGKILLFEKVNESDIENPLYPFDSQEDKDEYFNLMNEYHQEEMAMLKKYKAQSNRILNVLSKIKSSEWMRDLKDFCAESEAHDPFTIVRKPKGQYQEELEFPELGGAWVNQYTGHEPDDYYGTVTVKIDDKRWLEMPFHC